MDPPEVTQVRSRVQKGFDPQAFIDKQLLEVPVTMKMREFLAACHGGSAGIPNRFCDTIRRKRVVVVEDDARVTTTAITESGPPALVKNERELARVATTLP
jgi:hypothetical protein